MNPGKLPQILTFIAPIPAFALVMVGLLAPTVSDLKADRNTGQVLGGMVRRKGIGTAMENVIRRQLPVWVLGNSNANTDIDPELLSRHLGVPPQQIAVLSIPNANTAHWLAMLRKLRDSPWRPDLVLVVSRLQLVLVRQPISEDARGSLEALLEEGDEDLRVLANPAGKEISKLFRRREALRDRISRNLRTTVPRVLAQSRRSDQVLQRALSNERINVDALGRPPQRHLPTPDASLVPDLMDLVEELGLDLVVIRPPASPLLRPEEADIVPETSVARAAELFDEHGVRWVDMTGLEMRPYHYKNSDHLDEEGAKRFTGALISFLEHQPRAAVDALGGLRFPGGTLTRQVGQVSYLKDPPFLDAATPIVERGLREQVRWLSAPEGVPTDVWTQAATDLHVRCSPTRVVSDEVTLDPGWPCRDLTLGTSCHGPDRVGFMPPRADRPYWRLALDPERACDGMQWMYPGDRAEIRWPSLEALGGAPTHLEIDASPVRRRAKLRATLKDGDQVVAKGKVQAGQPLVLELSDVADPTLLLESDGFVLVTRAELVRR